ncbi:MAG: tetratricopeptide repeat protein [Verrucomicrobiae bacterium]|nr:tetratricopeptide repeat protein [Verrucomicrobiae bacterium]
MADQVTPTDSAPIGSQRTPDFGVGLRIAGIVAIVLVTALAYWPALDGDFIWDDDAYVTRNPLLTEPDGLYRIWFTAHKQSQYFPLTFTTLRFAYQLWGLNSVGYHALNIGLHCVNSLLVWVLLRRLAVPGAWLAAAIFALHPVQVESVAWITELKNVQSTLFYLLAVLAWLKFVEFKGTGRWVFYALALVAHMLALFSKTTACTLPAALVLAAWLRGHKFAFSTVLHVAPFAVAGVGMGLVSVWWEGHLGNYAVESGAEYGLVHRLLIAARAVWFYASKVVLPFNLTFSYPKWHIDPGEPIQYVWVVACAAVGLGLWVARHRVGRGVISGVVFFVAALSPLLGFFWLYTFRYTFVADHYQYLACLGLISIAAGAAARLAASWPVYIKGAVAAPALGGLAWLTWQQAHIYKNLESLWRDTIAKNPTSWMAHNNLGLVLWTRGERAEAESLYRKALSLNPDYPEAWNNLGKALDARGELHQAEQCFRRALALKPNFAEAMSNLGGVLMAKGELQEALELLTRAVQLAPGLAEAHNNLGAALKYAGDLGRSIHHYRIAAAIQPTNAQVRANLGLALALAGQAAEAAAELEAALEFDPENAYAHRALGRVRLAEGRFKEAVAHLHTAVDAVPDNPVFRAELADALMATGNAMAASTNYEAAVALAPRDPEVRFKLGLALALAGAVERAVASWRTTLEYAPDHIGALNSLAWVLATTTNDAVRNGAEALELAGRAAELTNRKNPAVLDTLAAAAAETGAFQEAVQTAQAALELATAAGNLRLAEQIRKHLDAYQRRLPWRE